MTIAPLCIVTHSAVRRVFRVLLLSTFPDTSIFAAQPEPRDPLPLPSVIAIIPDPFLPVFVAERDTRRDLRGEACTHRPQRESASRERARVCVRAEHSSKIPTDTGSRFRKTVSIMIITNRTRLITIAKK